MLLQVPDEELQMSLFVAKKMMEQGGSSVDTYLISVVPFSWLDMLRGSVSMSAGVSAVFVRTSMKTPTRVSSCPPCIGVKNTHMCL